MEKEFIEKISEIQSRLIAPKSQFNSFGKYKYRSAEDILEAVKPLLSEYKFTLIVSDKILSIDGRFYVEATATVFNGEHSISSSAYAREEESIKGQSSAQLTGSTSSYARKYALNGLFAIDDNKDSDSTNTHGMTDAQKPTVTKAKTAPKKIEIPASVREQMEKASTLEELLAIWNGNKPLQAIQEFAGLLGEHKKRVTK